MNSVVKSASRRGAVWGGLLIAFGILALVETYTDLSPWVWVAVLAASGLGLLAIYAGDRSQAWLLVPAYGLLAIAALVTFLSLGVLRDPFVAPFVLAAIALPFAAAFFRAGRSRWALLIPAYILLAVALMVLLIDTGVLRDSLVAPYVLFAVAIPFFVAFARAPKRWWALIPGAITAIVGLALLIAESLAQFVGPVLLIGAGVWLLVSHLRRKGV